MWDSIQHLRPALQRHIAFQPRSYRGENWYVLEDKSNGTFHRLSIVAYHLIGLMDGHRTVAQILEQANTVALDVPEEYLPDEEDLIALLQYLYVADLLICDFPPSTQEIFSRQKNKKQQRWKRLLLNPMSWKISLGNPDAFLNKISVVGKMLCHPLTGVIWLLVVGLAVLQIGAQWSALTSGDFGGMFSPANMFLLWLTYPLLKVIHELGHALFTKAWGGAVTECGVVFILGTPLPYVDATASTGFSKKYQRLMVSAAGMAVELFVAALAFLIWLIIEDGIVRNILFNLMVLGSVSTLIFNGNPLLKFDGYHLLCDAIEVPNLAARATEQFKYLAKRFGYGVKGLYSPASTFIGGVGFTAYAVGAFFYRIFIFATIIYIVAKFSLELSVFLTLWLLFFQALWPLSKYIRYLIVDKSITAHRKRAVAFSVAVSLTIIVALFVVPMPLSTKAEGVVWLPNDSQVRLQVAGEVAQVLVNDGDVVQKGQPIILLKNAQLEASLKVQQAVLREYRARFEEVWSADRAQAGLLSEDIRAVEDEIAFLQQKVAALNVVSPASGTINFSVPYYLPGSYFQQGDIAGYVVRAEPVNIRVALTQHEIGLVRKDTQAVEVRLAHRLAQTHRGEIEREVPGGTYTLPSLALSVAGGGRLQLSSEQGKEEQSQNRIFLLDVALPRYEQADYYGERAHVLFTHSPEPIAEQVYRRLRQLFISTLLY
ncbi:biotin/lipoyl-binding protein [Saccharophagus degradans]|uniref:Peptidase, M50 family n=1 Tax=Saccharophagus degradans (strain 2-40 / ATCC 43961 / DSM 17024) TaxID=203122 RepID=Q21FN7_SACD2|nr:biotin/lipoyl-binding protein [Saccharophagus degradans]ABD82492.1 peptidase, M50 family [Saccharophagus degradans 2-40]